MNYDKDGPEEWSMAVDNFTYGLGYKFLTFALLVDVMYRGWIMREAAWDLLGLVIVSGLFISLCQSKYKLLTRGWRNFALLALVLTVAVAGIVLFVTRFTGP